MEMQRTRKPDIEAARAPEIRGRAVLFVIIQKACRLVQMHSQRSKLRADIDSPFASPLQTSMNI